MLDECEGLVLLYLRQDFFSALNVYNTGWVIKGSFKGIFYGVKTG
jgi:hypothetical protein